MGKGVKILNLDEIAPDEMSVTWGGKSYPVELLTLEAYAKLIADFERYKGAGQAGNIEQGLDMLRKLVPTFPFAEARLSGKQLMALLTFVMDAFGEMMGAEEAGEAKPGEAPAPAA